MSNHLFRKAKTGPAGTLSPVRSAHPRAAHEALRAAVSVGVAVGIAFAAASDETAIVVKSRGLATVRYADQTGYALVSRGFLLLDGARLQTGKDGFVSVKCLPSRDLIVVRPGSDVRIRRASAGTGEDRTTVVVDCGAVFLESTGQSGAGFDLSTPSALAVTGAAKAIVLVSGTNGETTIFNLGRVMQVTDQQGRAWYELGAAHSVYFSANGFVSINALGEGNLRHIAGIVEATESLRTGPHVELDLTCTASPNGTVTPSGTVVVLSGAAVDIEATPAPGSMFAGWRVTKGAARIDDPTVPVTRITAFSDAILEAQFSLKPCRLVLGSQDGGAVDPSGELYVQCNTPLTVQVIPDDGYEFIGWKTSSNIAITEEKYPCSSVSLLERSGVLTAKFKRKKYRLQAESSEHGSVTPLKPLNVAHGDTVRIRATPEEGYRFIEWTVVTGACRIESPRKPETTVVLDSIDAVVQAGFSNNAVEVSVVAPESVLVEPSGNFNVVRNSLLECTVRPEKGFEVSGWETLRGRAAVKGNEHASVKCRTPFEIRPVVVTKMYGLTLMANGPGNVSPSGPVRIPHGQPLSICAVPKQGMHFIRWKIGGGWASIDGYQADSARVTLSEGPAVLMAEFAPTLCSLAVESGPGGYTEPGGVVRSFEGGEVFVRAVPNPKAAFIEWKVLSGGDNVVLSDTCTEPDQVITTRSGSASVRAVFSTDAVELVVYSDGLGTTSPEGKTFVVRDKWTTVRAAPNRGQSFLQWTVIAGTGVQIRDRMSAETDISAADNSIIKALFVPSAGAVSESAARGEGVLSILCDAERGSVKEGNEIRVESGVPVDIRAAANEGYVFSQWRRRSGNVQFSDPLSPATRVTVSGGDAEISALFLKKTVSSLVVKFKDYQGRTRTISSRYY